MFNVIENKDLDEFPVLVHEEGRDMPKTEKEALATSVEKWRTICGYYESGSEKVVYDGGARTCTLCWLYLLESCIGCPVYNKTNKRYCKQTPYIHYAALITNLSKRYGSDIKAGKEEIALAYEYAKAELKFLQDLFEELYPND